MSVADYGQGGKLRISVSHPVLGVLAAGKSVTPEQFAQMRDELRLALVPESQCHLDSPGPFAVVVIPFPEGWTPGLEGDIPHEIASDATSREEATRKAIRFNRVQLEKGWVRRWACVRISGAGARVLILNVPADWMPATEYDFPPVRSEGHSYKEAKRLVRQFNVEQLTTGKPTEWAIHVRHLAEDVTEFAFATGKAVQA